MTYQPKHSVRARSAPTSGPAGLERTCVAHAGPRQGVPHGGPVPAPRGWATGLLLAGWCVAFVGLVFLSVATRPADDSDDTTSEWCGVPGVAVFDLDGEFVCDEDTPRVQGVERDRPGGAVADLPVSLGDLVQSVFTPSTSTPQLPQSPTRLTVAQVARTSPAHADGRAHPAKSSSAISTPGA